MRLILIGPPGSGKGTQAKLLSQRLGLAHIATGDILREGIQRGTPAGKKAEPFVKAGQLVPDDVVNELIADRFRRDDRPEQFLMDGYPRTVAQAAAFDVILRQQLLDINAVVFLVVPDEEIVRRTASRLICPRCQAPYNILAKPPKVPGICDVEGEKLVHRADDSEETVRNRLKVYHASTEEVIAHYRRQGLLREVQGSGEIETIYANIVQGIQHK